MGTKNSKKRTSKRTTKKTTAAKATANTTANTARPEPPPVRNKPDIEYDKQGFELCGGKTKKGGPCQRRVVPGRHRCRLHGGATRIGGPTHHLYKHGRKSTYLPGKLGDKFVEAYNDPELLSHRKHAAIFDTRVRQLCERLYTGEAGGLWTTLQASWQKLGKAQSTIHEAREAARQHRDAARQATDDSKRQKATQAAEEADAKAASGEAAVDKLLGKIGETIEQGAKDEEDWRELLDTTNEASAMKTRETKRLESERKTMSVVEVMTLVSAIYSNCRESAETILPADKSKMLLASIGEGMQKLLHHSGGSNRGLQRATVDSYAEDVEDTPTRDAESSPTTMDESGDNGSDSQ